MARRVGLLFSLALTGTAISLDGSLNPAAVPPAFVPPAPAAPALLEMQQAPAGISASEGMELVDNLDDGPKPAMANGMEVVMEDQRPPAAAAPAPAPAVPLSMVQSSAKQMAASGVDVIMSDTFSMKAELQDEGEDVSMSGHMGSKYIALIDGADWNANSEVSNGYSNPPSSLGDCQKKCLARDDCVVGMWGTSGKRKGQCWLSSSKRQSSIPCLAPCLAFERRNLAKHNEPPVAAAIPETTGYKGVPFSFLAADHFSDPDHDPLSFSLQGLPADAGLKIDAHSGVVTGTPTEFGVEALQPIFVQIIAEDGKGGKAQGMWRLQIAAAAQ